MSPGRVRTCDGWRAALRAPAPGPTGGAQGGQRTSAVCEYRRAGQRDPLGAEMGARWVKRHCSRHAYLIAPPVTPSTTRRFDRGWHLDDVRQSERLSRRPGRRLHGRVVNSYTRPKAPPTRLVKGLCGPPHVLRERAIRAGLRLVIHRVVHSPLIQYGLGGAEPNARTVERNESRCSYR